MATPQRPRAPVNSGIWNAGPSSNTSNNAKVKLIIGIDYGTSFSGAAYTLFLPATRPTEPRIIAIADWPSVHHHHRYTQKVPSDIAYDQAGVPFCGFEVPDGATRLRWVKLLLETNPDSRKASLLRANEVVETRRALQTLGKSVVEVVGDYLKWLWTHITEHICEEQNDPDLIKNSDVTIIMTVPAMWSDAAVHNTFEAADRAGLGDEGRELKFLTEPEAAAISELQLRLTSGQVQEGDCVIVCDAGGGTVDLVSYQVTNVNPMELSQVVVAEGGLCGSIYIDDAFLKQTTSLLQGDWDKLPLTAKNEILDRFAYIIKPSYDGSANTRPQPIQLGGISNLVLEHIKDGRIVVDPQIVRISFESVLTPILTLIDEQDITLQEKGLRSKLKGVLLVGGLGSSRFIQSRVEQSYPRQEGVKVWRGRQSWTSVVEGSVRCSFMSLGNIHSISARLSRWNYGIEYRIWFDPSKHRIEDQCICPDEKIVKARQIQWLVRKGQRIVPSSAPQTHNFTQIIKDHTSPTESLSGHSMTFSIIQSGEENPPNYYTTAVQDCAEITCNIPQHVLVAARHRQLKSINSSMKPAWKVIVQLEIHMLATRVDFCMKMSNYEIGNTQVFFKQSSNYNTDINELSTPLLPVGAQSDGFKRTNTTSKSGVRVSKPITPVTSANQAGLSKIVADKELRRQMATGSLVVTPKSKVLKLEMSDPENWPLVNGEQSTNLSKSNVSTIGATSNSASSESFHSSREDTDMSDTRSSDAKGNGLGIDFGLKPNDMSTTNRVSLYPLKKLTKSLKSPRDLASDAPETDLPAPTKVDVHRDPKGTANVENFGRLKGEPPDLEGYQLELPDDAFGTSFMTLDKPKEALPQDKKRSPRPASTASILSMESRVSLRRELEPVVSTNKFLESASPAMRGHFRLNSGDSALSTMVETPEENRSDFQFTSRSPRTQNQFLDPRKTSFEADDAAMREAAGNENSEKWFSGLFRSRSRGRKSPVL